MGGGGAATRARDGGARGRPTAGGRGPAAQQAGADTAPVVPVERLLPDLLPRVVRENPVVMEGGSEAIPRRAGVPPGGGCHIHVAPREVGHQCAPMTLVRGVPVEEGQ